LTFPNADRLLWQLVLHILVLDEYLPSGFAIGQGDVVVDIGANRGVFVGVAGLRGAGAIHAFEPDSSNFDYLAQFVAYNALQNVHLHPEAVAGTGGQRRLYTAHRHTRHSLQPSDVISGDVLEDYAEVRTVTLEELLSEVGPVDVLKMDCEGAEYEILAAASDERLRQIRAMVIEVHGEMDSGPVSELVDRLAAVGFSTRAEPSRLDEPLGMVFARRLDLKDGRQA
jgi:FkbM family methyltransferase